jgi:hypothetical protein
MLKIRLGAVPLIEVNMPNPAINQIQVVPIRVDGVVVGGPWQALVVKACIGGRELRVAVGRQINASEGLIVQRVREGQRDGGYRIIPVITECRRAWHDAAADLSYRVMV